MVEAFKIVGGKNSWRIKKLMVQKLTSLIMIATLVEKGTYILKCSRFKRYQNSGCTLGKFTGLEVEKLDANSYKIINNGLSGAGTSYDLVKKMRASFLVMGGMLAIEKGKGIALTWWLCYRCKTC